MKKTLRKNITGSSKRVDRNYTDSEKLNSRELLENIKSLLSSKQESYVREINFMRDRFTHDSEAIKIGLDRLINSAKDENSLKPEIINRLRRFSASDGYSNGNGTNNLKESERYLTELEREIMNVLSGQFKK